jgi:hypothetical protein
LCCDDTSPPLTAHRRLIVVSVTSHQEELEC